MKVPAFVVSFIICLLVSSGATVMVMLGYFGYKTGETVKDIMTDAMLKKFETGGNPNQGPPKAAAPKEGPKAEMAKGLRDPRPAVQVVTLIAKLDALTAEANKLQLTDEQRTKVRDQLQPLGDPDFLGDAVAKQHMNAILDALKGHRETLEAAGFKWPSEMYDPNVRPGKNPFKEGEPAQHLKSLQERLAKS